MWKLWVKLFIATHIFAGIGTAAVLLLRGEFDGTEYAAAMAGVAIIYWLGVGFVALIGDWITR